MFNDLDLIELLEDINKQIIEKCNSLTERKIENYKNEKINKDELIQEIYNIYCCKNNAEKSLEKIIIDKENLQIKKGEKINV